MAMKNIVSYVVAPLRNMISIPPALFLFAGHGRINLININLAILCVGKLTSPQPSKSINHTF